ncbi:MAG: hypothetical protein II669_05540 [Elusimicrobia bacterium]|nr:hypothetical protein [Elusimicrobiota bacterium]
MFGSDNQTNKQPGKPKQTNKQVKQSKFIDDKIKKKAVELNIISSLMSGHGWG